MDWEQHIKMDNGQNLKNVHKKAKLNTFAEFLIEILRMPNLEKILQNFYNYLKYAQNMVQNIL